jgi:SulP family sulfate permease
MAQTGFKEKSVRMLKSYLPILDWGSKYTGKTFSNDMIVALIVTMMLIPQSLAYAILAGLPAEVGLYASMAPLILYAIFGSSRALAVGPVAVASLMTAAAAGQLASQGTPEYLGAAIALAMVSGLLLIAMGFLKLGFLANFLSHPVIAGFITASGLQIAAGQLGPVLGIHAEGESFLDIVISLWHTIGGIHIATTAIGIGSLIFLFWVRKGLKPLLVRFGVGGKVADILVKVAR